MFDSLLGSIVVLGLILHKTRIGDKGNFVPRQNFEVGKTVLGTVFLSWALNLSPNLTLNWRCWYCPP